MGEQAKLVWEPIDGVPEEEYGPHVDLIRAAVPGGWLIAFGEDISEGGYGGLTFMPDPQHTWKGGSVVRG